MREGTFIGVINFHYLGNGKHQTIGNGAHMVDFIEAERAVLAGFQIFVDHLIAADMEIPHLRRHGRKVTGLVDVNGLLFRRIAHRLHHMFALAVIHRQWPALLLAQQVGVYKAIAKFGQFIKLHLGVNEGNAREIDAHAIDLCNKSVSEQDCKKRLVALLRHFNKRVVSQNLDEYFFSFPVLYKNFWIPVISKIVSL